jgi:hypothetical protein
MGAVAARVPHRCRNTPAGKIYEMPQTAKLEFECKGLVYLGLYRYNLLLILPFAFA